MDMDIDLVLRLKALETAYSLFSDRGDIGMVLAAAKAFEDYLRSGAQPK
jgi:hypothetical protein